MYVSKLTEEILYTLILVIAYILMWCGIVITEIYCELYLFNRD